MIVQRLLSAVGGRVAAAGNRTVVIYGNFTGTLNMGDQTDESRKQLERERLLDKVHRLAAEPLQDQLQVQPIPLRLRYRADGLVAGSAALPRGAVELPPDTTIREVFEEQEQKLLVLGEDLSARTAALRELALHLVEKAKKDTRLPVPVVVSLASWSRKRGRLAEWLVDELSGAGPYDQNRDRAMAWLDQEQFLPLLLGLDEVDSTRRDDCVRAINEFHASRKWVRELAVACRTDDYEALLPTRLNLRGAVLLCPLSAEQIDEYLAERQLDALRQAIAADRTLQEMAHSPLTLSFMVSAYEDKHEAALLQGGSAEERQGRLVEAYVDSRFSGQGPNALYPREQATRWLGWLAHSLHTQGERAFYLDRLQPGWLPTRSAVRWYIVADRLGTAAIAALVFALLFGLHFAAWGSIPELTWIGALVGALVGGLLGGQSEPASGRRGAGTVVRGALSALVAVGVGTALVAAFAGRLNLNLVGLALVVGALVGALAGFLAGGPGLRARSITLLGPLDWSFGLALRHALGGLVIGGALGVVLGVLGVVTGKIRLQSAAADPLTSGLTAIGLTGLLFGLVLALGFALPGGLVAGVVEAGSLPNQAVRRSARRAALVLGGATVASGAVFFALLVFIGPSHPLDNVGFAGRAALLIGPVVGLVAALAFGGYACFSHLALRLVLWRMGALPFNCVRFLEYAKRCELLSRVSGGYEFRPGLLQHFAELAA